MFTKSRSLLSLSMMLVASLILSACGTPSTPLLNGEPSEPTGEVIPPVDTDKSITIVIPEDPPSFNPFVADTGYDSLVMELVMLGLADLDPNGNAFPELAAELPSIENGGVVIDEDAGTMSVTWTMRDDVQWSDGKPVTADDVIFTWDAISNPDTGSWIPGSDYIDSVEKVDQFSFVVNYNTLYPGYLTQFGGEQVAIWPAHYCNAEQGFLAWDCGREPLSDGPFVLHDWIEGDHMTFHRNENFYLEGRPEIQQVIVQIVPDDAVRKTMMMNGDADIDMWINVNTAKDLEGLEDVVKVSLSPTDRWVMRLYFNLAEKGTVDASASPHPILSDVNVRKAIRLAVDVDTITQEIFFGLATPTWTEFFRPPYQCEVSRPAYDPEAAKAMLEQAGWTDSDGDGVRECNGCATAQPGHVMEMDFITYAEFGEPLELTQQLIAEMLGAVGIKMNISIVEGSVLWDLAENGGVEQSGNFDIDIWDDGYAGVDPTDYLWELYSQEAIEPGGGYNVMRWDNPSVDALIDEAYTLDEASRKETFCGIADYINEEVPLIHLFTVPNAEAYSARITGVQSTVNDLVTWNIADWIVK